MIAHRKCPKCQAGEFTGPRYERVPNELRWTCGTCGHVRRTKPMAQVQEATIEALRRAQERA